MNTSLAAQQREFAAALRAADVSDALGTLLRPTLQGIPARFDIYRNAYRSRLEAALKENYPVLFQVLGDEGFSELASAFLKNCPSRKPSIRWFGEELADFVQQYPEHLPHPALADLIRMEWALSIAFDSADAIPLVVEDLLGVAPETWPELRFSPHPSLQLLQLNWNIEPLWSAISADAESETEPPVESPHHLLVWRLDQQTQWRSSEECEARLLSACIEGEPFSRLCELATLDAGENAAAIAAGYLRTWIDGGLLCKSPE